MKTRIQKWGNSLAIRIPKAFARELGLDDKSTVEISLNDGELAVRPVPGRYSLESLVAGITKRNRHDEEDFGPSVGREAW